MAFLPTTTAQRRMSVLAMAAALFSLVNAAFDVVAPLWVTGDLGLSNADWAHLRSLRMSGTFAGILVLGMVSEELGSRRMAAFTLACAGLALALMASGGGALVAWLMPCFGALISTIYVNFNSLTQQVSDRRQGLANSIYRGVGAGMAIVAPVAATTLAARIGGYGPVLVLGAGVLASAGLVILIYPEPGGERPVRTLREVLSGFRQTFTNRGLLRYILLDQSWSCATACIGAFAALRFTRELGLAEHAFGALCTAIAVVSLLVTVASGLLADRLPLTALLGVAWTLGSAAAVVLGLSDSLAWSIAAFAVFVPLNAMTAVPASIWISRVCGSGSPTRAFTVFKIFQSGVTALTMAALGWLEPRLGMHQLFLWGGLLSAPLGLAILLSRPPARRVGDNNLQSGLPGGSAGGAFLGVGPDAQSPSKKCRTLPRM